MKELYWLYLNQIKDFIDIRKQWLHGYLQNRSLLYKSKNSRNLSKLFIQNITFEKEIYIYRYIYRAHPSIIDIRFN